MQCMLLSTQISWEGRHIVGLLRCFSLYIQHFFICIDPEAQGSARVIFAYYSKAQPARAKKKKVLRTEACWSFRFSMVLDEVGTRDLSCHLTWDIAFLSTKALMEYGIVLRHLHSCIMIWPVIL
jgi:hypothetical protein